MGEICHGLLFFSASSEAKSLAAADLLHLGT